MHAAIRSTQTVTNGCHTYVHVFQVNAALTATETFTGLPIKYISLIVLVIQNSAYILTLRASRIQVERYTKKYHGILTAKPGPLYAPTTAVVLAEALKMLGSIGLVFYQERGVAPGIAVFIGVAPPFTLAVYAQGNTRKAKHNIEAISSSGLIHAPGSDYSYGLLT
jgi:hypothetical protein